MTSCHDWVVAAEKLKVRRCTEPAGNSWHMNWGITQHEYQLLANGHCRFCNESSK